MVQEQEIDLIQVFKDIFIYSEGKLFWGLNSRLRGREAGCIAENYRVVGITLDNGTYIKMLVHRIIFAIHNGYLPDLVDHIDQNPNNNYPNNLRDADKTLNAINTGIATNNKSGIKGVCQGNNKWVAQIKVNGNKIHLGTFNTIEDATTTR